MKIICEHGYFFVYEEESGEVAKFNSYFGQDLVLSGDHYTFLKLADLKKYSIKNTLYSNVVATKTFEGEKYEIMRQNNIVYNFISKMFSNKALSGSLVKPTKSYNYYIFNGLIVPGSFQEDTIKILGYTCKLSLKELIFRYGEFKYV